MPIRDEVGETAGKIWHLLNDKGPQTLGEIRKELGVPNELLNFAVGWLAREDKIEIAQEKKAFRILLK
jgi:predicted ArsR family transcriptional regulator